MSPLLCFIKEQEVVNMRLNLDFQSKKLKDGTMRRYYSLAKSYRDENGKSQKNRIERLGALSNVEVKNWKLKLGYFNTEDINEICHLSKIKIFSHKRYLDVAVISAIYDKLKIDKAFEYIAPQKDIGTADVAKTLIISRSLDPKANYKTVDWFKDSFLPAILNISQDKYNKDKIFRELSLIHERKNHLQKLFYTQSNELSNDGVQLYFFDGTTSYFEGTECVLSRSGKDKTSGYQSNMILICLMTNKNGFPVAWDVAEGNKRDISEFKKIASSLAKNLDIFQVTYCFDRGIASSSNFDFIEDILESKYVSGLDSNQISKVFKVDNFVKNTRPKLIEDFENKNTHNYNNKRRILPIDGFYKLGTERYYKDLGINEYNNKIRNIVSFNINIYYKEKRTRENLIQLVKDKIKVINMELKNAKGDRDGDTLAKTIDQLLSKYKLQNIINYILTPIALRVGKKASVQSYRVEIFINEKEKELAERLDGILVYITNHTESSNGYFDVSSGTIVGHYRDKHVIENAFRHLKTFLKLRPFFVWLEEHVRAHVDICMSSYFIDHYITEKLRPYEISIEQFYLLLEKYAYASKIGTGDNTRWVLTQTSNELIEMLQILEVDYILNSNHLRRYGIQK